MQNRINQLLGIKYPIIQGGMIWNSGWKLASEVSRHGGLGLLGAGSMYPDELTQEIKACKQATKQNFGVNLPLLYPDIEKHIETIVNEKVKIVFTSAGNPKTWTPELQRHGIKVVHVVSSLHFAKKAEAAGVDAIVAEGFEAGGHNGRDETTTFCLLPHVCQQVRIPVIAAGGIATGAQMYAAQVLGAEGVQLGSRFAATKEASSHLAFKEEIINAKEGDTKLTLKELAPVRLLKNEFYDRIEKAYEQGATTDELKILLGRGRAKKGMKEGDLINGELEIGQCASLINKIKTVEEVVQTLIAEYQEAKAKCTPWL